MKSLRVSGEETFLKARVGFEPAISFQADSFSHCTKALASAVGANDRSGITVRTSFLTFHLYLALAKC